MTEHLPILIVLAPLLGAVFAALASWFWPRLSIPIVLHGLAVSCVSSILLVFQVPESGVIHYQLGGWVKQEKYAGMVVGIQISVDFLNGLILAAVTTIALLTAIYSQPTVERELEDNSYFALFSLLVVGLLGIRSRAIFSTCTCSWRSPALDMRRLPMVGKRPPWHRSTTSSWARWAPVCICSGSVCLSLPHSTSKTFRSYS